MSLNDEKEMSQCYDKKENKEEENKDWKPWKKTREKKIYTQILIEDKKGIKIMKE